MTPVISPWVFYWLNVADTVSFIVTVLAAMAIVVTVIVCVPMITNYIEYGKSDADYLRSKAVFKPVVTIAIIFTLLATFIPTQRTITKMIVAQNVTYERVEMVEDTVQQVYEDIIDLFEDEEVSVND